MEKIGESLTIFFKVIKNIFSHICKNWENIIELFKHKGKKEKGIPACCIKVPEDKRPRPDPFIYSQDWLTKRGLSVTWQNPDFTIFDMSGNEVASNKLKPKTKYRIEIVIHNSSPMAALDTNVSLTIHPFGIQTGIIWGSSTNLLDIPPIGSNITEFFWDSPDQIGHICLRATIFHIDDANPMNNVGQHNTNIIEDGDKLFFKISNFSKSNQQILLKFDTYSLPKERMKAKNIDELKSIEYLRKLQKNNTISGEINTFNQLKEFDKEILLESNVEEDIEINQDLFNDSGLLNISAFSINQVLLGGVTFTKNK